MKPITKLASTTLPDGSILDLWERDGFHFLLRDGVQLASSFSHGSNAEPCKPLVDWHQELMDGERPGFLHDPRVSVEFTPALQIARKNPKSFHAILCRSTHERMNLSVAEASDYFAALKQGGLLVITVARPDVRLARTLQKAGFEVSTEAVPASHKGKKTTFHTVILGKKGRFVPFSAHQS